MEKKAKGEIWTDAKYIRKFINEHHKYNKEEARNLINTLLETGNIYLITRSDGARDLVLSKTNKDDILNDLYEELGKLSNDEIADKIIEKMEFE